MCKLNFLNIIFRENKTSIRDYRLFNIAIIDVIFTILSGIFIGKYFNYNIKNTIIILFLLGIIIHRLLNIRTTIDSIIFFL